MNFKLHYYVRNNGDGSASAIFCKTKEEAEKEDEGHDGWAEPSANFEVLCVKNGKIFLQSTEWDGKKHKTIFLPLEEVSD